MKLDDKVAPRLEFGYYTVVRVDHVYFFKGNGSRLSRWPTRAVDGDRTSSDGDRTSPGVSFIHIDIRGGSNTLCTSNLWWQCRSCTYTPTSLCRAQSLPLAELSYSS